MLKRFLFTALLVGFALSANAQIATPQLDNGFHTYGGAAAGWRYGSTISLVGITAESKVEVDEEEVGDFTAGFNAKGPEDNKKPVPFMLLAYRGENFAGELYTNLGDGIKRDTEIDSLTGWEKRNQFTEEKKLRVNLAYVFNESLSIGLGYSSLNEKLKNELESAAASTSLKIETDTTTVGTSLTASFRLAEIFFIAAGVEAVKQTGTYKSEGTLASNPANVDQDYAENSWTNTMAGISVLAGDPGETQLRLEYSVISSPESEKKDETGKQDSVHPQTTLSFASAEAKFGDFLVAVLNENEKEAELNDEEQETNTTQIGLGWKPLEGFTISLYSVNSKITSKKASDETVIKPQGYRLLLGYNF